MNVQTVHFQGLFFVNVTKPTDFEMKFLKNTYGFDPLALEDYLHRFQVPKIENHNKYNLVVLRFPIRSDAPAEIRDHPKFLKLSHTSKIRRLASSYVDFFISQDQVVVVHEGILPEVDRIFAACQKSLFDRTEYMGKGAVHLAYKIIDALVDGCFPIVNEYTSAIDHVDKELEEKQSTRVLEEISIIRKDLVVFHTMIKPLIPLFKELEEGKHMELNGSMKSLWRNVLGHLQKIHDRVEDNQELIEGISESNESFIMTQTNLTIRVLTVITVIILPLQVLGGFYGMNVEGLPFTKGPNLPWIHIGMIIGIVLPLVTIFKWKKWI